MPHKCQNLHCIRYKKVKLKRIMTTQTNIKSGKKGRPYCHKKGENNERRIYKFIKTNR